MAIIAASSAWDSPNLVTSNSAAQATLISWQVPEDGTRALLRHRLAASAARRKASEMCLDSTEIRMESLVKRCRLVLLLL